MGRGVTILVVIILIVLVVAVFLQFFYAPKCKNLACWDEKLRDCDRAKYINDAVDVNWKYIIKGKSGDKCVVVVEVINVKKGLMKTRVVEGKKMECYLPEGVIMAPESDINLCQGRLKEEMQTMIIEKLHQYIIENIGEISEELNKITETTETETTTNSSE